jgi:competence protein ComEC
MPGSNIGFIDYLGGMYCRSRIIRVESAPDTVASRLAHKISQQHQDEQMRSFYKAIFLAYPVKRELRQKIASLGVSHLVALSGFHLGILWGVLYAILLFFYKPLQKRYFPYRYDLLDIGMVVMAILGYYLWLTGFPPSLVRSYAMMLIGWSMLLMGIELISFTFLATVSLALLALFPALLVSLSFWLSVGGVFYIFLVLQYCRRASSWVISLICIPVGIFVLMQPVVHYFFALATPYQLLSPILSILFIVFYPLVFVLHLLGYGDLFDMPLERLFSLPSDFQGSGSQMPIWGLVVYAALSLMAIWNRKIFYLLTGIATVYTVYLMI